MNILTAGIFGTLAMSLGTAALTVFVAASSVFFRESTLFSFGETKQATYVLPVIEVIAGAAILVISIEMAGLAA